MFGTSKSLFSHGKYCKSLLFMEIVFKEFRCRFSVFFGCLGTVFLIFFGLGNKLENETFFSEKPDHNEWIW